jgi:hypothetical protein
MTPAVVGNAHAPMGAAAHNSIDLTGFRREGLQQGAAPSSTNALRACDAIDGRRCDSATRSDAKADGRRAVAADDVRRTTRGSAACGRPRAAIGSAARRIDVALRYAPAPRQIEGASE